MTDSPALVTLHVPYDDPRAVALRDVMDAEMMARYSDPEHPGIPEATQRALHVDPSTVVTTVLVLDAAGAPVAHGAVRRHGVEWEVKRVVVLAGNRGRGVGRVLLAELERIARADGAPRLILQTGDRQPEAVALYTRIGYTPIDLYEPYASTIPFSLCFEKVLSDAGG